VTDLYANFLAYHLKPVADLLDDPTVTEVLINGPDEIYVEREGRLEPCPEHRFRSDTELMAACINVAQFTGKILDDTRPRIDGSMPDGSRVHIVIPPLVPAIHVAIRKFSEITLDVAQLIVRGALNARAARLLEMAIQLRLNILVSGGTGSGKTTLLNALSGFIDPAERVVVLEDVRELKLQQPHVVQLVIRAADKHGQGEVTTRDLLVSALRMRPDRILVGEVRGPEALDLLSALNSGHGGTMASLHANSCHQALTKLETLCLFAGEELPLRAIRMEICNAVQLVVQISRLADGSRRICEIAEVHSQLDEGGGYRVTTLLRQQLRGKNAAGRLQGDLEPTGVLPSFLDEARAQGLPVRMDDFRPDDDTETLRRA